ncbi:hypothetical protein GCM10010358_20510 [Streptomyces minutiscleroticus]|uniref:Uncharacterized protein n=1 Tax=Streptomyces minutiscleroticus TaxID=68238 RepID=A0A918KJW9_9ACTN|nr:hypothetical protein GCM10010358_20510 [Streptomyces minutiscleroticus]
MKARLREQGPQQRVRVRLVRLQPNASVRRRTDRPDTRPRSGRATPATTRRSADFPQPLPP